MIINVSSYIWFITSSLLYDSNKGVSNLNKSISLKVIYVLQYPENNSSLQWLCLNLNLNYNYKFFALVFIFINAN